MSTFTGQLPESFRRRMAPEDREAIGQPTQAECDARAEVKAERELHEQFEQWLRLNRIPYIHSRMDRKPTIRKGWPDFTCFRKGAVCCVEFKLPGKEMTDEQMNVAAELFGDGGVRTCRATTLAAAIVWVKQRLDLL